MEETEITALVQRISAGDPSLTKLQLNHACLGPAQSSWILNEILPGSNIIELQLQQNYLGTEGVTALLSAMDNLKQLKAMDLRFNHLNAADIKRIWRKMQQNFTLEDVRIDEDLGDEDEVPFQIVVGVEAAEADGLTWSTFSKSNLAQMRTRILELLAANRRIAEVRPCGTIFCQQILSFQIRSSFRLLPILTNPFSPFRNHLSLRGWYFHAFILVVVHPWQGPRAQVEKPIARSCTRDDSPSASSCPGSSKQSNRLSSFGWYG